MSIGFVILAFLVGGFLGSMAMALACAAHDDESFESIRDEGLSIP